MEVEAIFSFEHGGARKRGDRFEVSDQHAEALRKARLVRFVAQGPTAANPSTAAGAKSSASPAAPASPRTTAKPRARGAPKLRGAASL